MIEAAEYCITKRPTGAVRVIFMDGNNAVRLGRDRARHVSAQPRHTVRLMAVLVGNHARHARKPRYAEVLTRGTELKIYVSKSAH